MHASPRCLVRARRATRLAANAALVLLTVLGGAVSCAQGDGAEVPGSTDEAGRPGGDGAEQALGATATTETEADWAIARGSVEWALDQQLDQLPVGEVVAMIGARFVGTPYAPGSLEVEGPEQLVVNLSVFDCVTLVEHALVLARIVVGPGADALASEDGFRDIYRRELTRLRYRGGVLGGYPSRLHYFSEWIADADSKGVLESITRELGGVTDDRPIDFMSRNTEAYRQLVEDPSLIASIRETEARLSSTPRYVVPETEIAGVESRIRNGDVIAAVSSLDGLDIAHTGIALWQGGRLHLLHAPLVGDSVEVSERPLAERILGFSAQTGIMVARPLEP